MQDLTPGGMGTLAKERMQESIGPGASASRMRERARASPGRTLRRFGDEEAEAEMSAVAEGDGALHGFGEN